jgi:hypothetical protein
MDELLDLGTVGHLGSLLLAAALLAAAMLSLEVSSAAAGCHGGLPCDRAFWRLLSIALLLLAANSLLEGELMLLGWLRELALAQQWYEWRRPLQLAALGLTSWMGGMVLSRWRRILTGLRFPPGAVQALRGLALLACLPLLRGLSFHYTDVLVYWRMAGLALGRWVELLGLALVALAAWRQWRLLLALQALRDR